MYISVMEHASSWTIFRQLEIKCKHILTWLKCCLTLPNDKVMFKHRHLLFDRNWALVSLLNVLGSFLAFDPQFQMLCLKRHFCSQIDPSLNTIVRCVKWLVSFDIEAAILQ